MREIKFRYIYKHKNTGEIKTEIFDLDEIEQFDDNFIKNYFGKDYNIFLIEQFTGLKDKNGVEIYEGDICEVNFSHMLNNSGITYIKEFYYIEFFSCGFRLRDARSNQDNFNDFYYYHHNEIISEVNSEHIEIIGNIHENPELLEEKA